MEFNEIQYFWQHCSKKPDLRKHDTLIFIGGFSHKILALTEKAVLLHSDTENEHKSSKVWIPLSQIKVLFSSVRYASSDGENWFKTTMTDYICKELEEKFKNKLKA